jgi:type II secretory pathway component PulF
MSWASSARFYHQLALVHRAGIPIAQSIEMAGAVARGRHAELAPEWSRGCAAGASFADQLAATAEPPLALALVRAGERAGKIPEMAGQLAEHYDHLIALRSLVISRLLYPLLMLHVALIAPMVPGVFLGTRPAWHVLIGPVALWLLIGSLAAADWILRGAGVMATLALRAPLSFLVMPLIVGNTARVVRAALSAGMLVPESLELAATASANRLMSNRLIEAASRVRGQTLPTLAAALAACGYPRQWVSLIESGGRAGKDEESLQQVAIVADEQFKSRTLWTARIFTGGVYALAMLIAVITIVLMYQAMYLGPINEAMKDLE